MENKRIWAMVGVLYMVIITLLMTYWIATTSFLTGITGLLLAPLSAGMAVQCFNNRWKLRHPRENMERPRGTPGIYLLLGIACSMGTILSLITGAGQLIANFAG